MGEPNPELRSAPDSGSVLRQSVGVEGMEGARELRDALGVGRLRRRASGGADADELPRLHDPLLLEHHPEVVRV